MGKVKVTLSMDEGTVKTAHKLGLNISKVSENALKEAIARLKGKRVRMYRSVYT